MLPQSTTSYLYDKIVQVQILVDPFIRQRNKVVYAQTLKLYKGITNEIKFEIKNPDQKPVDITGYSFVASLIDDDKKSVVVFSDATILDAAKGIVSVKFNESQLQKIEQQFLTYSIIGKDAENNMLMLYIDDNFTARGQAQLLSGHFPEFKDSIEVTQPSISTGVDYSNSVAPLFVSQSVQFDFSAFTGDITVQATMDPAPSTSNLVANWFDVETWSFVDQSLPVIKHLENVFPYIRFGITTASGSVTKILYRG